VVDAGGVDDAGRGRPLGPRIATNRGPVTTGSRYPVVEPVVGPKMCHISTGELKVNRILTGTL